MRAKLSSEPRARRKKMTFHLLSLFHFFCHYFSFFSRSNKAVSCVQLRIRTSLLIHRLSRTTADFMFLEMRPAPHQTRTPSQPMRRLKDNFDSMRCALENTKYKACNIEFAVFMAGKAVVHSNAFRLVSTRRSKSLADIDDCKHAAFFPLMAGARACGACALPFLAKFVNLRRRRTRTAHAGGQGGGRPLLRSCQFMNVVFSLRI